MSASPRGAWSTAIAAALLLAVTVGVAVASAAEEPTRTEYVARLEQICRPGSDATERAVKGVRADVRAERLKVAAGKFAKAERIFSSTVRSISVVPRPAADRITLRRWFAALGKEEIYLGQMVDTLRAEDVAGFERVSARFIHEGNKANNAVVSFGFDYCSFKPSRFQ
ncbi:MAG TPA: hypothetical protein VMH33_08490 [Solirubrobacterales bacterium]|nr:hypothetical protein [Solirubrobacterales bacterium]